ncbi:MAG: response regulator [Candidatus Wallbacteria bacterium]|nr:response regulator [Candidatus Wallbacteria bacterium]
MPAIEHHKTPNVLIIDDDEDFLKLISPMLKQLGMFPIPMAGSLEAVAFFRQNHLIIDFVLMDYRLPVLDGCHVFTKLKSFDPEIKCILCTASDSPEDYLEAMKLGMKAILKKPFTLEDVTTAISLASKSEH